MWKSSIRIELKEPLGEGAQGCVFKALRVDGASGLTQTVAVKVLHSETAVELWKKEFESLSRVRSPYCVQVFAFERVNGRPALVLELVDGVSLLDLGRMCVLGEQEIDEVIAQIQNGLVDLEAHGICHGDLGPQNVMVDRDGRVRLLDFGLANGIDRLTAEFAAPERLNGAPASLASDLYSLGRIESFLRGEALADSSLLHIEPARRDLRAFSARTSVQASLASTIRAALERRHLHAGMETRTHVVKRRTTWPARALTSGAVALLTTFTTPGASVNRRDEIGCISFRTKAWHFFVVDGRPVGYAPVTVPLTAGQEHSIEWASPRGKGRKRIRVRRDEQRVLQDRDFSH